MAAQVTRTLSIAYGSWKADSTTTSTFQIQGKYRLEKKRLFASVSFQVWVVGSSVSAFKTLCDEIETAFETRQQRLTIKFGDTVFLDADPAANTGKNAEPSIVKPGSPEDSDTSRVYECTVSVNRPSTGSALTEESATIQYSASNRRTLTITGQYNATASTGALALYRASIEAFADATKDAIDPDAVWQAKTSSRIENMTDPSGQNDRLSFTLVYQELIWDESLSGTDSSTITDFTANFTISKGFPGDAPGHPVKRVVGMTIPFHAPVDKNVTKNLSDVWLATVRPWIIRELKRTTHISALSVEENVDYNYRENIISGTLNITGVISGSTILSLKITTTLDDDYGKEITKVLDGTPYGAEEDNAIPEKIRTLSIITEKLGMGVNLGVGRIPDPIGEGARWVTIRSSRNQTRVQYGMREVAGENYIITIRSETWIQKWVTPPGSGTGVTIVDDNAEITGIIETKEETL